MKPMKEGETKMVHMNESWVAVSNEVTEENCEELTGYKSQGAFEIGNLCAKKMPSNFIFEYKNK
jgi:regulator of sigma D